MELTNENVLNNVLSLGKIKIHPSIWYNAIPNATGTTDPASKRICTPKIKKNSFESSISVEFDDETYNTALYQYDSDGNVIKSFYWAESSPMNFVFEINCDSYIVGVKKVSEDVISPNDGKTAVTILNTYTLYDEKNYSNGVHLNGNYFGFEIGSLIPGDGGENASDSRIRSAFISAIKGMKIRANVGFKVLVYKYAYNGYGYFYDGQWTDGEYVVDENCYIRVLGKYSNDATITDASAVAKNITIEADGNCVLDSLKSLLLTTAPSYYNMQTKLATANANMDTTGADGFTFIFATDVHWERNTKISPLLVSQIIEANPRIKRLVLGGDYINGGSHNAMLSDMQNCINAFAETKAEVLPIFGNHDSNTVGSDSPADYFTNGEVYNTIFGVMNDNARFGNGFYYSMEFPREKTKIICLDTGVEGTQLSAEQSDWFDSELNSLSNGWKALIFAHIIYESENYSAVPLVLTRTAFMNTICNKCDAFNANNPNRKVEAIIGGHVHSDWDFTTEGGIPIVLTTTNSLNALSGETATKGAASETALDIITVDYGNKTIKCTRIGRGSNRTITY